MLKLCKNHSKSFKVPFWGARKKERKETGDFFSFASAPSFPLSLLSFLHSCLFLPASIIIRYHSIPSPFRPSTTTTTTYPLVHILTPSPFQPFSLSLTLCIFFYCFPLNYGNQLKLRGLLLKALEFDYYNHIYKGW